MNILQSCFDCCNTIIFFCNIVSFGNNSIWQFWIKNTFKVKVIINANFF